jgi:hypothetical protein
MRRRTKPARTRRTDRSADVIVLTPRGLHLAADCRRHCPVFDWAARLRKRTG